ncbi:PHB depolymerase family esterase [Ectobacillus sp. JY-23]|uniref:extracellular catalytic domain type 1 short-chain-length polyhydroxyalkanoate depolymerase n=1 Tax=Ectobacillus sp. JY-23 TaxID=2933872 RepID=UPI001FF3DCF0|nr:PHB depolymerase family esterase [Ectobacillus sp. JY-23]UOY92743.1 PHB depolymerase family esterase [Ectobacillus sp. JY-23]
MINEQERSSRLSRNFMERIYRERKYRLYVPDNCTYPSPLIVMLHGCTQDSIQFAAATNMNALAEKEKFFVMYPEQTTGANPNKCWNWFDAAHQTREKGEPALIAGMVEDVKRDYDIAHDKVFVAGLSAGGAMSVILGVAYADVFTAIAVCSGLEYKAAPSILHAYSAMRRGGPLPAQQGDLAYAAMGMKKVIPVIVFHGMADRTVHPCNGHQVAMQWVRTNSNHSKYRMLPPEVTVYPIEGRHHYNHTIYRDSTGRSIVEEYMVENMGHVWSGGNKMESFTDEQGPDATQIIWEFFKKAFS